jgi:hypothetical protein
LIEIQKSYINTNHPEFTRLTAMGWGTTQMRRDTGLLSHKDDETRGGLMVKEIKDKKVSPA